MSEDFEVLKEYFTSLGLDQKQNLSKEDLADLKNELKEAGEFGLVNFLNTISSPNELFDYLGEEE